MKKILSMLLALAMLVSLAACGNSGSSSSQGGSSSGSAPGSSASSSGGGSSSSGSSSGSGSESTAAPSGATLTEVTEVYAHSATKRHDSITVVAGGDPGNLLPQDTHNSGKEILDGIFDRLYIIAGFGGDLLPLVAADMPVDNGDGTYDITIRDNVVDSDGNPLTASDVAFSYEWLVNNSTPQNMDKYHGAEAVSDYVVRFTCDPLDGVSDLGNLFAQQFVFTEKAFNDHDFATDPVGTGPYKLESFTAGSEAVLTARDDYWCEGQEYQTSRNCANVQTITYKIMNDVSQQANAMRTGELDYSLNLSDTDLPDFLEGGEYSDRFGAFSYMDNLTYWLSANCSDASPCSDINFRKAIMYAVDASACASASGNTGAELVYDFYNSKYPEVKEAWSTTEDTFYTNPSLETAQEYLSQSSYDGEEIELVTQDAPQACQDVATVIATLLQSIGINCKLTIVTASVWNDVYANDDSFDLLLNMMASDDYGVVAYARLLGSGQMRTIAEKDPELERLVNACNTAATHTDENVQALHDLMINNAYGRGLFAAAKYNVITSDVTQICNNYKYYVIPGSCIYADNEF